MEKIKSLIIVSNDSEYVVRDLTPNEFSLFQSVFADAESGVIIECSRFNDVIERCWNDWQLTKPLRYDVLREIININHKGFCRDYFAEFEYIFDMVKNHIR